MMKTVIKNGRVITPNETISGYVLVEDGVIKEIGEGEYAAEADKVIDAEGCYVSPGFIDLHTHGAGGADFMDGTVEAFLVAAKMHAAHGATLVYPTTLTSSNEVLFDTFVTYEQAVEQNTEGAAFGGLHLEGPYFNPLQAGAQDPRYLRNPDPADYLEILSRSNNIARVSFSPELEGAPEFAAELSKRGIIASAGHTNATFEQCDEAFKSGSSLITHFFSCVSTIVRKNSYRTAGVLEYGYYQDGMAVEIIADGCHVPESLLKLIVRVKGFDNVVLVTDSMRGAGMPEGPSILGGLADGQACIIEDGVAKLMDRSGFAGSVCTTDRLIRTMTTLAGVTVEQAVKMASYNPARVMGIADRKGSLEVGKDADIVIFNDNVDVAATIVGGRVVYSK
ncbi:MAG: N-acetylglucosamine-6-phosphate deacetylase [Bacteroidales bacterium]|nr:N-acetylglucosamine-6-phosphate deacetylase [Bacteroidales bacterium]